MTNYTPTDQFDFNNIPLTGVLVPGATVGYIAESKFIKGGYIVVKTVSERDALLDKSLYEDKEIAIGTPVFVSDENKTYRYMGEDSGPDLWLEDIADLQQVTKDISDLQQIALDQKTEIDEKANQEDLAALANATANSFTGVETSVNAINANISTLQEQVDKNTSDIAQRVDGNTFFAALMNIDAAINAKASTEDVNQQIGIINENTIWDSDEFTTYEVGGLAEGSALKGKSVKEILMMILYGYFVLKPTYDPKDKILIPTVTIEDNVGISSNSLDVIGTVHFDRGEILLNGEHQNWLAGKAYSITITNPTTGTSTTQVIGIPGDERVENLTFTYHFDAVPLNETDMEVRVNYIQGAQPVDNFGNPIDAPFPAGTTEPATFKVIGLTNTWTGNENDLDNLEMQQIDLNIIRDDSAESAELSGMFYEYDDQGNIIASGSQFPVPAWTASPDFSEQYSPVVLIADGIEIVGIKVWDAGQGSWEWYRGNTPEETLSSWVADGTVEKSYNDQTITYRIYKCNSDVIFETPLYFRFYVSIQEGN